MCIYMHGVHYVCHRRLDFLIASVIIQGTSLVLPRLSCTYGGGQRRPRYWRKLGGDNLQRSNMTKFLATSSTQFRQRWLTLSLDVICEHFHERTTVCPKQESRGLVIALYDQPSTRKAHYTNVSSTNVVIQLLWRLGRRLATSNNQHEQNERWLTNLKSQVRKKKSKVGEIFNK